MTKEKVSNVSEKEFSEVFKKGVVVADFFADWCMPCTMMSPMLEDLAGKHSKANFLKVNIAEAADLSQSLGISSIPCIVMFKEGQEVERIVGSVSQDFLDSKINNCFL